MSEKIVRGKDYKRIVAPNLRHWSVDQVEKLKSPSIEVVAERSLGELH